MGVPITFLDKYNPEQFEIMGCSCNYGRPIEFPHDCKMSPSVKGKDLYKRLFIKRISRWGLYERQLKIDFRYGV